MTYRCPKCLEFGSSPGKCNICGGRKEKMHELRVMLSEPEEDNEGEHFIGTEERNV